MCCCARAPRDQNNMRVRVCLCARAPRDQFKDVSFVVLASRSRHAKTSCRNQIVRRAGEQRKQQANWPACVCVRVCVSVCAFVQAIADEDRIYAVPAVLGGGFDRLDTLLAGGGKSSEQNNSGIVDDSVGPLDEHTLSAYAASAGTRVHVFRVVHFEPKRQKVMKSAASTLRSDHIAVAMFDVEASAITK